MAYVKLFGSILASTIWAEPASTRIVWIAMLALADRDGCVSASVPGLAHLARVSEPECIEALAILMAADPDSRTKDHDGRRIAKVDGGWSVLNYEVYRDKASAEESKEKARLRQQRKYTRDKTKRDQNLTETSRILTPPHADLTDLTLSVSVSSAAAAPGENESTPSAPAATAAVSPDPPGKPAKEPKPKVVLGTHDCPEKVPQETWDAFLAHRKAKRAPVTIRALELMEWAGIEVGMDMQTVLDECIQRNWVGFRSDWILNEKAKEAPNRRR